MRVLPAWEEFDPGEVPDLLPYLVVVELVGTPPRYRVRLYGTAVSALRGGDLTGRFMDEPDALPPGLWTQFAPSYAEAVAAREPIARMLSYRRPPNETVSRRHCRIILPFARGGGDAVAILLIAIIPVAGGERPPAG